ncbi:MAG: AsmA family protein [bacterium]|nr:AsmA family protein [bacterium]
MRRTLRIATWTGGSLLGLVLLGLLAVWIFLPMEKIMDLAVEEASTRLGRPVTVAEAGLSLKGGLGVVLTDVTVGNPPGFTGENLLTAEGVDLKLRIGPLLKQRVEADRLVVLRPRLNLLRTAAGLDNFTFVDTTATTGSGGAGDKSAEAPAPMALEFDRIEAVDARVIFRDETAGTGVRLAGLAIATSLGTPAPGTFALEGEASWDTLLVDGPQPLPILPGRLDFMASFDQAATRTTLTRGDFEIAGLAGSLTADLTAADDAVRTTGHLAAAELDPSDLLAFVPAEHDSLTEGLVLGGRLRLEADFDHDAARAEPLVLSGRAVWSAGTVAAPTLPQPVEKLDAAVSFTLDAVIIESCEVRLPAGTVAVQGRITDLPNGPEAPAPTLDLELRTDLDLAAFSDQLPPELEAELSGRLAANVTLRGAADDAPGLIHRAEAAVKDLAYTDTRLPAPLESLQADLAWENDVLTVAGFQARFPGSDASGRITVHNLLPWALPPELRVGRETTTPEFDFALRSQRLDVDRLLPAASPGAEPIAGRGTGGGATSGTDEPLAMPELRGGGTVAIDTLIYSRVELTDVATRVELDGRRIVCPDLAGNVYTGTVAGAVTMDLTDLDEPLYAGDFKATRIEADDFLVRFTRLGGLVFGKFDLEGSYAAAGRDPERLKTSVNLDSRALMKEGRVVTSGFVHDGLDGLAQRFGGNLEPEQALRDLATAIRVENGRIILDDLKTSLGELGDLQLGGSYGLGGDLDYAGTLLLSESNTRGLLAAGVAGDVARLLGADRTERLALPLRVDGSFASPRFGLDYSALTQDAADSLADEAKKKLKGLFD